MTDSPTRTPRPDRPAAVATLIGTTGSSPRTPGARMWVDDRGAIVGAVTIGGCVDARVIELAQAVLASGTAQRLELALGEEDAAALGMTCAGSVEVLVEPVTPGPGDPVGGSLAAAEREVASGRAAALVVALDGGPERVLVREDGSWEGSLARAELNPAAVDAARERLRLRTSGIVALGAGRAWVEVHAPPVTLLVFGATHVAQPLCEMARVLGLRVVVVDGRDRYATRERFPAADELLVGMPGEIAGALPLTASTLVVLLSHDYKYDLPVLRRVVESEAGYIGCLGSARRGRAMLDFLREEGVSEVQLARVRMPVGLDIGARTPAEIALSVLAEALAVIRGREGGPMRERRSRESVG